jgi:hypothetical protein
MQRHDAAFISNTILAVVESQKEDQQKKFQSVVTDQPSVMTAAWKLVEEKKPWITCYGCGAHALNLLASDLQKITRVAVALEHNKKVAKFFKSHSLPKQVLKKNTKEKYGKELSMVLGCATRWSTNHFMVRRTIRIRAALQCSAVDGSLAKDFKACSTNDEKNVRQLILDDDAFFDDTRRVEKLLHPLTTAIRYCEGDNVPVSAMYRIWAHIDSQLDSKSLEKDGWDKEDIKFIMECVKARKMMNIRPVSLAAYILDPRFHGSQLSAEDWSIGSNFLADMATRRGLHRLNVIGELTDYKAKTGTLYSDPLKWEAVGTSTCTNCPARWWAAFFPGSDLGSIAQSLLSMPATAALVERCNKTYACQKTKVRNRLSADRAAKLAMVAYNLQIQRTIENPSVRSEKRAARVNIMALSTTPRSQQSADFSAIDDDDPDPDIEVQLSTSDNSDDDGDETDCERTEDENSNAEDNENDAEQEECDTASMITDNDGDIDDELTATSVSLIPGQLKLSYVWYWY